MMPWTGIALVRSIVLASILLPALVIDAGVIFESTTCARRGGNREVTALFFFWSIPSKEILQPRVDRERIIALFEEIRAKFPALRMDLQENHPDVDVIGLEWFPCTDPEITARYREAVIRIVSDARLKSRPTDVRQRPGAPVKQPIEVGVTASEDKTRRVFQT